MSSNAGIQSVTNGQNPNPSMQYAGVPNSNQPPTPPSNGAGSRGILTGIAVGAGSALISGAKKTPSGSDMGEQQKAFNEAAYPDLNPWEAAGASAAAGTAQAGNESQAQLQAQQNKANMSLALVGAAKDLKINDQNNETAKEVAGVQSTTALSTNQATIQSQAAKLKKEIEKIDNEIRLANEAKSSAGAIASDVTSAAKKVAKPLSDWYTETTNRLTKSGDQPEWVKTLQRKKNQLQMEWGKIQDAIKAKKESGGVSNFDPNEIIKDTGQKTDD